MCALIRESMLHACENGHRVRAMKRPGEEGQGWLWSWLWLGYLVEDGEEGLGLGRLGRRGGEDLVGRLAAAVPAWPGAQQRLQGTVGGVVRARDGKKGSKGPGLG